MAAPHTIERNGRAGWALMTAIHDALRRDLDELLHTTASRTAARARWTAFRDQLRLHLAAEGAALWPRARRCDHQRDPTQATDWVPGPVRAHEGAADR